MDQLRATAHRLAEELRAAHDQIQSEREGAAESSERHDRNAQLLRSSLRELEEKRASDLEKLQVDVRDACREVCRTQNELMPLRREGTDARVWGALMGRSNANVARRKP